MANNSRWTDEVDEIVQRAIPGVRRRSRIEGFAVGTFFGALVILIVILT